MIDWKLAVTIGVGIIIGVYGSFLMLVPIGILTGVGKIMKALRQVASSKNTASTTTTKKKKKCDECDEDDE